MGFKWRLLFIFVGAIAVHEVLNLPAAIQSALDSRAAEAWRDLALANLPKPTTRQAIEAWLKSERDDYGISQYERWRDGEYDTGTSIWASRLLSKGGLLTDPASADMHFYLRSDGTMTDLEMHVRPFLPLGSNLKHAPSWPRELVKVIISLAAILWMSILIVRRQRRRRHNLCLECGYDLRGTDHDRCQECGASRVGAQHA